MAQHGSDQSPEWQNYSASHHQHVGLPGDHPLREVEFNAAFLAHLPPPPARILEIGFGHGGTLRALQRAGYTDLVGWDIAKDCVGTAEREGVLGDLHHLDAFEGLERSDGVEFDVVLAKDLLEHLPRERVIEFVRGIHRILKPGGIFLARLPNMANPLSVLLRYDDFTHTLGFTDNSLRQVLSLGGFERDRIVIHNDVLPGLALLRRRLFGAFLAEKIAGPVVRQLTSWALLSQRKGPSRVRTLRLIVVAEKAA